MLKLEKLEFGGIKGKALSDQVVALFEEFDALYRTFLDVKYDILDPKAYVIQNDSKIHVS